MDHCQTQVVKSEQIDDVSTEEGFLEFNPISNLLVKFEVSEEELSEQSPSTISAELDDPTGETSFLLRCQKCHVPYSKQASYKNHVAVCQRNVFNKPLSKEELELSDVVREEMKRSIKILERSCFEEFDVKNNSSCSEQDQSYHCSECQESFTSLRWYARHVYAHTFVKRDVNDLPHICPDCGQDFATKFSAREHTVGGYKRGKKGFSCTNLPKLVFPCHICQMIFTRKDNLREHLRAHAGMSQQRKRYDCRVCKRAFGGLSILNIHARSHMKRSCSYSHACNVCMKTFTCASSLKKHFKMHQARQFQCPQCPLKFATKTATKKHFQLHTLDISIPCEHSSQNDGNDPPGPPPVQNNLVRTGSSGTKESCRTFDGQMATVPTGPCANIKTYTRKKKETFENGICSDICIKEEPVF